MTYHLNHYQLHTQPPLNEAAVLFLAIGTVYALAIGILLALRSLKIRAEISELRNHAD